MPALAEIIAGWKADADALKRNGESRLAGVLLRCAEEAESAEEISLVEWISEARAVTRSGHERRYFVRRRQEWAARGLARETKRGWEYRACVCPDAARVADDTDDRVTRALGGWAA